MLKTAIDHKMHDEYMVLSHLCRQFNSDDYRGDRKVLNLIFPYSQYHMVISRDEIYLNDGISAMQDMEYQGSIEMFISLIRSETDPYHAYGKGEFYITGDRMFFFEMSKYFHFRKISLNESEMEPGKIFRGPFNLPREFSYLLTSLVILQIWFGWVFSYNNQYSFAGTLAVFGGFCLYYWKTDKLTRTEIYLLFYLGASTILFFLKSDHYMYFYNIYFLLAVPVFFGGTFYSRIRNTLTQYNAFHVEGMEIISAAIIKRQRKVLTIWLILWILMTLVLYLAMNTGLWVYLTDTVMTVISLILCGAMLLNLFAINGFHSED